MHQNILTIWLSTCAKETLLEFSNSNVSRYLYAGGRLLHLIEFQCVAQKKGGNLIKFALNSYQQIKTIRITRINCFYRFLNNYNYQNYDSSRKKNARHHQHSAGRFLYYLLQIF